MAEAGDERLDAAAERSNHEPARRLEESDRAATAAGRARESPSPHGAAEADAEPEEEKLNFDVKLTGFDPKVCIQFQ